MPQARDQAKDGLRKDKPKPEDDDGIIIADDFGDDEPSKLLSMDDDDEEIYNVNGDKKDGGKGNKKDDANEAKRVEMQGRPGGMPMGGSSNRPDLRGNGPPPTLPQNSGPPVNQPQGSMKPTGNDDQDNVAPRRPSEDQSRPN